MSAAPPREGTASVADTLVIAALSGTLTRVTEKQEGITE